MAANEFEMLVCDLFHLQDGRTVFVGTVKCLNGLIQKCPVEVLVNEKVYKIIELGRKCLLDIKHPAGHRAISTSSTIDLTADVVRKHQCKLRTLS